MDIERLPPHYLTEMVSGQEQGQRDPKEHLDEMETDIYSLEHQENVEEFNPKGITIVFFFPASD